MFTPVFVDSMQSIARRGATIALSKRRHVHRPSIRLEDSSKPSSHVSPVDEMSSFEEMTAPTWSVHELLSTYPAPKLSPAVLSKLHKLSALKAPEEGSDAFTKLQREMEELIRLVEAVKLVDTTGIDSDGRIWPHGRGITLEETQNAEPNTVEEGNLLKHAAKSANGLYVVD